MCGREKQGPLKQFGSLPDCCLGTNQLPNIFTRALKSAVFLIHSSHLTVKGPVALHNVFLTKQLLSCTENEKHFALIKCKNRLVFLQTAILKYNCTSNSSPNHFTAAMKCD